MQEIKRVGPGPFILIPINVVTKPVDSEYLLDQNCESASALPHLIELLLGMNNLSTHGVKNQYTSFIDLYDHDGVARWSAARFVIMFVETEMRSTNRFSGSYCLPHHPRAAGTSP
jgi:hypothetical protein